MNIVAEFELWCQGPLGDIVLEKAEPILDMLEEQDARICALRAALTGLVVHLDDFGYDLSDANLHRVFDAARDVLKRTEGAGDA